jgi:hypothetical protein
MNTMTTVIRFHAAVAASHERQQLDELMRLCWEAYYRGALSDTEAQGIAERIFTRQRVRRGGNGE